MPGWLDRYRRLPRPVLDFAAGQFLINLIHASQFLLLNLYLKKTGMDDPAIAAIGSHRFVATLFLALPAGLWLRGRPLRKPLLWGSILFPVSALLSLESVRMGLMPMATAGFLSMGLASLVLNVGSLPMVMRLTRGDQSSEALSLLFASWAAASVCGGFLSTALQAIGEIRLGGFHVILDEYSTLLILTLAAFAAPWFHHRLPDPPATVNAGRSWFHIDRADWPVLGRALVPTVCIATGAGLSIQFLNLFFSHAHQLGATAYAGWGTVSNILVFAAGLFVPEVKRRFGWRGAILGVQGFAVILLVTMGLTELAGSAAWALPLALACFIIRQPLMSMAGPSISELTMTYVGERNRELMSACSGAIWSGAWWLAARTFQILRSWDIDYWQFFMATAVLYACGLAAYIALIRGVEKRPGPPA